MATQTELSTPTIPGSEGMEITHETSLHRVSTYPIVADSLSTAYSLAHSNPLLTAAYTRAETLSTTILEKLVLPIAERLPIERVDGYANGVLDVLESRFPFVKDQTKTVVEKVRSPVDEVYAVGKGYVEGVQSLANSATGDLQARIVKTQELVHSLLTYIPRDQASLVEQYGNARKELDSLRTNLSTSISELPVQAQTAYAPYLDGLNEGIAHFQSELARKDITLTEKATNLTTYSKEKVLPLLAPLKELILRKKTETEEGAGEVVEEIKEKVGEGKKKSEKNAKA